MKNTLFSPIIIPTMSRYEHLKRCIESLAACKDADHTDLYVSVDYPPSEKHKNGHRKIIEYLKNGITGFSSVNVFIQNENLGMTGNFLFLLNKIREFHKSFIYTEDDNVFSENFLDYVNTSLEYYENDKQVIAVSGYNYPIDYIPNGNTILNNLYFSYHGCGMWISRYDEMRKDITVDWVMDLYHNSKKMRSLKRKSPNQYCNFVKSILEYTLPIIEGDKARDMDLTCGLYLFDKGKFMAYPTISKVKNTGYDGSGADCEIQLYDSTKPANHRNYPYNTQTIDEESSFDMIMESDDHALLINGLNDFFYIPSHELIRTEIAYWISRLLGISFVKRMVLVGKRSGNP